MGNKWGNSATVADFILGGYKITAAGDCNHEIKRRLFLGRKVIANLDSILKSRDITLPTKVHLAKAMVSFHSNPKKDNAKECSNYCTIALISHASKVMLKILQARLQQYVNRELPDVQTGFRKGRGTRDQITNICWIIKKQESSRKTSISALLIMPKPLTVWITINCGKF